MSFDWRYGVGAIVTLWLVGALCSGLFVFFFGPARKNYNPRTEWRRRLGCSFGLSLFLWPFLLPAAFGSYRFRRCMRAGKRPSWLVYADNENNHGQWTLSDGTEFLASAYGGSPREPSHFLADYMSDEIPGKIGFRVRMIAPEDQPFTDWQQLALKPQPTSAAAADPDDNSSERYEAALQLERGKYAVEFRAQNRTGAFEERGGVTLIVADPSEYD